MVGFIADVTRARTMSSDIIAILFGSRSNDVRVCEMIKKNSELYKIYITTSKFV
jgi:hypothetical protein